MALTRALGLILFGFLCGIIFSQLSLRPSSSIANATTNSAPEAKSQVELAEYKDAGPYSVFATTGHWDVLKAENGRHLALGRSGSIQIEVVDDQSSLHIMTYQNGGPLWEGRLMDVGNDGTFEVANITGQSCENFSP